MHRGPFCGCQGQKAFVSLFECSRKKRENEGTPVSELLAQNLLILLSFASGREVLTQPYFFLE